MVKPYFSELVCNRSLGFQELAANIAGKVRRATMNGREYLVAPMSLIVPGVLNGSKGSLYYPPDEISSNTSDWNHTPIVVYHPTSNMGEHISARSPGVLDRQGIGVVLSSRYKGKLAAEGWFDVEATRRVDNRVYDALIHNMPLELSTGLFTYNEPAAPGSHFKGKPYQYIARDYRPDHVAVLPDQVGACSINDGCGVMVNKESQVVVNTKRTIWQKLGEALGVTNIDQPRHPANGTYQGKAHNAAKKGHRDLYQSPPGTPKAAIEKEEFEPAEDELDEDDAATELVGKQTTHDGRQLAAVKRAGGANVEDSEGHPAGGDISEVKATKKARSGVPVGGGDLLPLSTNAWSEEAREAAAAARKASTHANKVDTKGAHAAAETAHLKASAIHEKAGNDKQASYHSQKAQEHSGRADDLTHNVEIVTDLVRELVSNPAVSEAQRRYLNQEFGHDWVKEHDFDNKGSLPEYKANAGDNSMSAEHEASKHAASATVMTEHPKAREHALAAMDHSGNDDCESAIDSHEKAAKVHEKAATGARKDGDEMGAQSHDHAAALHRKAASMHSAVMNQVTDVEGEPNMATLQTKLTKEARKKLVDGLSVNCSCNEDKIALNELSAKLSDQTLIALNAKKKDKGEEDDEDEDEEGEGDELEGNKGENVYSFDSGAKGSSDQAGGKGTKEEYKLSGNQLTVTLDKQTQAWLSKAPAPIRNAVHNAMTLERKEKVNIVRRLTANLADGKTKNIYVLKLLQKPLAELQEIAALLPPVSNRDMQQQEVADPAAIYLGLEAPGSPSANRMTEEDKADVLVPPTLNYAELSKERQAKTA